jgi:flagellar protein FlaG
VVPIARASDVAAKQIEPAAKEEHEIESGKANELAPAQPEELALDKVVEKLNRNIQHSTRALLFSIDERHGKPIVSVVDKETNQVIRQIPSEVALQVADALDAASGALVSEHA